MQKHITLVLTLQFDHKPKTISLMTSASSLRHDCIGMGIDKSNVRWSYITIYPKTLKVIIRKLVVLDVTVYPLKLFYSKVTVM
jgi:hypothetical protein